MTYKDWLTEITTLRSLASLATVEILYYHGKRKCGSNTTNRCRGQSVATITTIDDDHVAIVNVLPANDIKNELVSIETTNAQNNLLGNDQNDAVALISVVVPMDASDSTGSDGHVHMPDLSAIKDDTELSQQVASGQVTLLQTQTGDGDEGTPQFITVTGMSN
ncbi:unnamed protein product [Ceratitis capitata]|uniref:(Mediterranean fruit fly) hypothetical protein n=1 Tax=Ceratitis capitata TaxID=7213 RepID=A0A811U8V9_CERCA|nr:unnamed protein product [Ceratitis capitata]